MHMCVSLSLCGYECACSCVRACVYVCVCLCVFVCVCLCVCVCSFLGLRVLVCLYFYLWVYLSTPHEDFILTGHVASYLDMHTHKVRQLRVGCHHGAGEGRRKDV